MKRTVTVAPAGCVLEVPTQNEMVLRFAVTAGRALPVVVEGVAGSADGCEVHAVRAARMAMAAKAH